jgi:hypothetical protein
MSTALDERSKALEDAFFRKKTAKRRVELRQQKRKEALAEASGLQDDEILERLSDLGIAAETVAAMSVVPLVAIAWADGHMDAREIGAVLKGATECGIEPGSAAHDLLESWTREQPGSELMETWKSYIHAVCVEISAEQRWRLEDLLIGRAQAVAAAAGGFLGIGKISGKETTILETMRSAFKV